MLDELSGYTDEQLWTVVHVRMSKQESGRLHELSQRSKSNVLTPDEEAALERLLEQVDGDILLRSEALLLLKMRGHDVSKYIKP